MEFPRVTHDDWRALVEKELAGKPFDKVLVHKTIEGLSIAPLYTKAPEGAARPLAAGRGAAVDGSASDAFGSFRIATAHGEGVSADTLTAEVEDGADALWVPLSAHVHFARHALARTLALFEVDDAATARTLVAGGALRPRGFALAYDPLAIFARSVVGDAPENAGGGGGGVTSAASRDAGKKRTLAALDELGAYARAVAEKAPDASSLVVSTLPYHEAGADAVTEIAAALATTVRYLDALVAGGVRLEDAARALKLRIAVGRDTFVELCKLRALRLCVQKVFAAALPASAGTALPVPAIHAVSSTRTLTARDPWVNMLRVTTQVFAAALGGADFVTPAAFDAALGAPSALGRRVARNAGLVLRDESFLGKIVDPGAGSYCFETLTDTLAREAWQRFRAIENEGGLVEALASGRLGDAIDATWKRRLSDVASRKTPILGVSEFANLDEVLPRKTGSTAPPSSGTAPGASTSPRRDALAFEALRTTAEAKSSPIDVALVTLGTFAETRPRVGFAASFFAAGGLRSRETAERAKATIACLCGTDEQYAANAATVARELRAAGCRHVVLAGRPGDLEASLRDAGVDAFVYVGCDALSTLRDLMEDVA